MSSFEKDMEAVLNQLSAMQEYLNANIGDITARTLRTTAEMKLLMLVAPPDLMMRLKGCTDDHARDLSEYAQRTDAILDAFEQRWDALRGGLTNLFTAMKQVSRSERDGLLPLRNTLQSIRESIRTADATLDVFNDAMKQSADIESSLEVSTQEALKANKLLADTYLLGNAFLGRNINLIDELLAN